MASNILPYPETPTPEGLFAWGRNLIQALNSILAGSNGLGGGSNDGYLPGEIKAYIGQTIPAGWVALEGQVLTVAENPGLHRIVGDKYKQEGDAAGTFRLPDARDRVPYHDPNLAPRGGASGRLITQAMLPAVNLAVNDPGHTHVFTGQAHTHAVNDPQHTHAAPAGVALGNPVNVAGGATPLRPAIAGAAAISQAPTGVTINPATQGGTNAQATTGITVALGGQAQQLDVRQAWFGMRWIMKV